MAVCSQAGCGHGQALSRFLYLQGEFGPGSLFGSGSSLFTRTIDNPDSEAKSNNSESPVGRWGSRRAAENGAAPRSKAKNGMCGFLSWAMQHQLSLCRVVFSGRLHHAVVGRAKLAM